GKSAAPVWQKPSTWINVLGGAALIILPRVKRLPATLDTLLTVGGSYMTTKVWDVLEQAMVTPAAAPKLLPKAAPPIEISPPLTPPTPAETTAAETVTEVAETVTEAPTF
ncbi:MAG: hypothetical protein QXH03_11370, partial [Candidatus Bathyarchaeia archaeon]